MKKQCMEPGCTEKAEIHLDGLTVREFDAGAFCTSFVSR